MMGMKLHPQPRRANPPHGSDDHRMKLLLAVIDGPEADNASLRVPPKPPVPSTKRSGTATPPALENEAPSSIQARRNLFTPTQDTRTQLLLPLARPPMLPSAAMVRAHAQHKTGQSHGLKMPPALHKASTGNDGRQTYALNAVNYNHMPRTITVIKKTWRPTPKPSVAAALARRQRLKESSSTRISKAPASPSQLHSVCCWGSDHSDLATIIVDILTRDPMAIRRKCQVAKSASCTKKTKINPFAGGAFQTQQRSRNEPYQFPLNLALHHQSQANPNMQVLEVLVATGPDVLRMQDGRNGGGSLTIALRHHPCNVELVQLLLKANPNCIKVSDRRGNTPLHVACFQGSSLDVIEEIYQHDPTAIDKTNMCGETPWQIIQRNSLLSSSPVAEFLYACTKRREGRMRKSSC